MWPEFGFGVYVKDKVKSCDESCRECVICKGAKLCCNHNYNIGYHGCVTWKRKLKVKKDKK